MRGPIWIGSYAALSIAVLWVTLAVINLHLRDRPSPGQKWPGDTISPGLPLPPIIGRRFTGEEVSLDSLQDALVLLISDLVPQAYGSIYAAHACAKTHGLVFAVVVRQVSGRIPEAWLSRFAERCRPVSH